MTFSLGGIPLDQFIQQALASGNYTMTTSFGGVQDEEDIESYPTESYENITIPRLNKDKVNLVFCGTKVGEVTTNGSINVKPGSTVNYAQAKGPIEAHNSVLGRIHSEKKVDVRECSFNSIAANGSCNINNCNTQGLANSNGSLTLNNCSTLSCQSNGNLSVANCQNLGSINSNGNTTITNSSANRIFSNGNGTIIDSTIVSLEIPANFNISGSTVKNLTVTPDNNQVFINGRRLQNNKVQTIYLDNCDIENITFIGNQSGKIVLRGTSKVTGKIINGKIINSSF